MGGYLLFSLTIHFKLYFKKIFIIKLKILYIYFLPFSIVNPIIPKVNFVFNPAKYFSPHFYPIINHSFYLFHLPNSKIFRFSPQIPLTQLSLQISYSHSTQNHSILFSNLLIFPLSILRILLYESKVSQYVFQAILLLQKHFKSKKIK